MAGRESLAWIQNPGGQKALAAWVRSSEEAGVSTHLLQVPLTASFHLPGKEGDIGKGRDPLVPHRPQLRSMPSSWTTIPRSPHLKENSEHAHLLTNVLAQ